MDLTVYVSYLSYHNLFGTASVSLNQSWYLQNHIKTVHAIAVCNLVEMAMGLVAEATIPSHLRWLPMGMDVTYKKKATGRLTAVSNIDPDTFFKLDKYPGMVKVPVTVTNSEGVEVTAAEVRQGLQHICDSYNVQPGPVLLLVS